MFRRVDCFVVRVPSLEAGLAFYQDKLGHRLRWRLRNESAGLELGEPGTELVLRVEEGPSEADLLVPSVETAVPDFIAAGGTLVGDIEQIPVGKRATLRDPWGNELLVLDLTNGVFETDSDGNVIGRRRAAGTKASD